MTSFAITAEVAEISQGTIQIFVFDRVRVREVENKTSFFHAESNEMAEHYLIFLRKLQVVVCFQAFDVIGQLHDRDGRVTGHPCRQETDKESRC